MISGQNIAGEESMTHGLSSHGRKRVISGQKVVRQESMTYGLSRHRRKQTRDQWTECHRTGIDDLLPVEASEEASTQSADRMSQDRDR